MKFNSKKAENSQKPPKGGEFLAKAKQEFMVICYEAVELEDQFDDLDRFVAYLSEQLWTYTEKIAKQSWKNGVIRGESRKK